MSSQPERSSTKTMLRWAAGMTVAIAAAFIIVLASRGSDGGADPTGDVRYVEGKQPRRAAGAPIAASMADIAEANVLRDGSEIVFEITAASPIPQELERSSLEYRFDISERGRDTWIVSATVNIEATAVVVSQVSDYGSSTIDKTMPGSVEVSGKMVMIRLEPQRIDEFPETFDWVLSSNLIAFRDITGSTRVEDRFPDEGSISGP